MTGTEKMWPDEIFKAMKDLGITQVAYVPDAGHTRLIELCNNDTTIHTVTLTTEEEGVAMLAGTWLGGQRGALLMQSSGIGNCVNMFSAMRVGNFPLLTIITMRGQWGETNPWQIPMGQNAHNILKLSGFQLFDIEHSDEAEEAAKAAGQSAFQANQMVALIISQRLIGAKTFNSIGKG